MLSQCGMVFALGSDKNAEGVLGLGEGITEVPAPTPNEFLKYCSSRITSLSCGQSSSMIVCENGHIFGWGTSLFGAFSQPVHFKDIGLGHSESVSNVFNFDHTVFFDNGKFGWDACVHSNLLQDKES